MIDKVSFFIAKASYLINRAGNKIARELLSHEDAAKLCKGQHKIFEVQATGMHIYNIEYYTYIII